MLCSEVDISPVQCHLIAQLELQCLVQFQTQTAAQMKELIKFTELKKCFCHSFNQEKSTFTVAS